ncbi:MAG: TIGR00730 family Rossman fold protein [Alphaproteobacteria bacterium]|nr:TIGR00730 family Rossman fold protein [Alphaproteobacteria bacterium]
MSKKKSVCVFCGASNSVAKKFLDIGAEFGNLLAKRDITLVYGGGDCGIMGAVANSTMKNGGHVTGVFPVSLRNIENEHQSLTEIIIVNTMHERKQLMFERSDAFIVFPGGFGTMDEMFEILTWKQLLLHEKEIVIFNYQGYWDPLIALMHSIIENGFAKPETATYFHVVTELEQIIDVLGY